MVGKELWHEIKSWFAGYFIFLVIAVVALALSCLSFRKANSSDSRVDNFNAILTSILELKKDNNSINTDSLKRTLINLNLQQETYTEMLGRQSDWFIMYVSLLFVILGLFGFVISQKTIGDIKRKNNKDFLRQKKIHDDFVAEFNELKFEVYQSIYMIRLINTESVTEETAPMAFLEGIGCAEYFKKALDIRSDEDLNEEHLKEIITTFLTALSVPKLEPKFKEFFTKDNSKYLTRLRSSIDTISNIKNIEIKDLCSDIMSKLISIIKKP